MREHPAPAAVLLARARADRVQAGGELQFGGGVLDRARLGQDEARVVGLGRPGKAELAADLEQLVVVLAVAGVAGGRDGLARAGAVAAAGRGQPAEQVQLRRALAVGEEAEPAAGKVGALLRVPAPVSGVGRAQPQPGHQRAVVDARGVGPAGPGQLGGLPRVAEVDGGRGH